jgi:ribosomal protein L11 methyltransferase
MCWVAEEKRSWLEASLECNGELAEAAAEVLARFAPDGVAIQAVTRYDTEGHEQIPTGNVRVAAYLPYDEALEANRLRLEEAFWHLRQITPFPDLEFKLIADQDWMAAWKQHYQPLQIGQKWLVLPAWIDAEPAESRTIVRIDPAMAFGTGTHPSTQLCLLAIEAYLQPGQALIDLGCGSGILAIAALKAGASFALAVDTDAQAVQATVNNAGLNEISGGLEAAQGSLAEILAGQFAIAHAPLVLANILAPVIIQLFEQGLAKLLTPGGKLVLSGILENQAEEVLAAGREAGLELEKRYQAEDWVALVMG